MRCRGRTHLMTAASDAASLRQILFEITFPIIAKPGGRRNVLNADTSTGTPDPWKRGRVGMIEL